MNYVRQGNLEPVISSDVINDVNVVLAVNPPVCPSLDSSRTSICQDETVGGIPPVVALRPDFVRHLPPSRGGRIISLYNACVHGNCSCIFYIGGLRSQLHLCRIGFFFVFRCMHFASWRSK